MDMEMPAGYVSASSGRILVRKDACERVGSLDGVILDCDGTLVDVRNSYDRAIVRCVQYFQKRLGLRKRTSGRRLLHDIDSLRGTGEYNNDWDACFVCIILSWISNEGGGERILEEFLGSGGGKDAMAAVRFVKEKLGEGSADVGRVLDELSYPGMPPESLLATVFDEIYYGRELFQSIYGREAVCVRGRGLIFNERRIADRKTVEEMIFETGRKPALLTGRPRYTTELIMEEFMPLFDTDASIFIGDLRGREMDLYRKPSSAGLKAVAERMGCSTFVYVGDSAEDMLMARKIEGKRCLFAGVCEHSCHPEERRSLFISNSCDMVLDSIIQLPEAMRLQP